MNKVTFFTTQIKGKRSSRS